MQPIEKHPARFKFVLLPVVIALSMAVNAILRAQDRPPLVFGVLADIQYADKDDKGARHYRTALRKLEECVTDMNERKPAFVIQLGDLVDGQGKDTAKTTEDLNRVLSVYDKLAMPKYHVLGNHCLNAGMEVLREKLALEKFYYEFTVPAAKGWRFLVLDGNDAGYGVMSEEQLRWFRSTLIKASREGERVICFCHFALLKKAAKDHRMAKPNPLLKTLDETRVVVAWFAGHDHAGGYALRNSVHHVTIKGMVEAPKSNAYALIEIHPDKIVERGFGDEPSRELSLPSLPSAKNQEKVAEPVKLRARN